MTLQFEKLNWLVQFESTTDVRLVRMNERATVVYQNCHPVWEELTVAMYTRTFLEEYQALCGKKWPFFGNLNRRVCGVMQDEIDDLQG